MTTPGVITCEPGRSELHKRQHLNPPSPAARMIYSYSRLHFNRKTKIRALAEIP
jgi:hypothetical protein